MKTMKPKFPTASARQVLLTLAEACGALVWTPLF